MAKKKGTVVIVKLKSSVSPHCYYTKKNRKNIQGKLELRKYDPVARAHVVYHETAKL